MSLAKSNKMYQTAARELCPTCGSKTVVVSSRDAAPREGAYYTLSCREHGYWEVLIQPVKVNVKVIEISQRDAQHLAGAMRFVAAGDTVELKENGVVKVEFIIKPNGKGKRNVGGRE